MTTRNALTGQQGLARWKLAAALTGFAAIDEELHDGCTKVGAELNMIGRALIGIVGILLLTARLFWQFLEWLSRGYVMTDQRVVTVAGGLRVRVTDTPLSNITHSELFFSLRERFFALGTLGFNTAGTAFTEAYWVMIAKPLDVHAKVVETLKRYRR